MPIKTFVSVTYDTDETGAIRPLEVRFRGSAFEVDRVMDVRPAAAAVGGSGMRYQVRINGRKTYLFHDDHDRWFVEEKDGAAPRTSTTALDNYQF